jgi:sulfite exporter TauE/SafE
MDYGMLFITGLATSAHCAVMCGGINLSQCVNTQAHKRIERKKVFAPALLYNGGRVISYTISGAIVGALGTVMSASGRFAGAVQLAAGAFMVIMGVNMLGIFPALRRLTPALSRLHLPDFFAKKARENNGLNRKPLLAGLLNGLMPCGPLQAMQLYALSTGSPVLGALSMFVFSVGTLPLMAGIGALSSFLSGGGVRPAFARRVTQAGAVLITVMGMMMLNYGVNLTDFASPSAGKTFAASRFRQRQPDGGGGFSQAGAPAGVPAVIENGVQVVNSTLSGRRYPSITVRRGIPVRWIIDAPAGSVNGCNNRAIIREYGIEHRFKQGENIIEFFPERAGNFRYSCWMGMIRGNISVVEEGDAPLTRENAAFPVPAGVSIPAGNVTLAELSADGSYQTFSTRLDDGGMDAAVIVVQRGLPALWTIDDGRPDGGELIFPSYRARLDMEYGDNIVQIMPTDDFDFSTADNVFYAYVKAVEDLNEADIEAIRKEAAERETLIYPEDYFGEDGAASCCAP